MAKMNYSKPLFGVRPIPLAAAGNGGGCSMNPTSGDGVCPIRDIYGDLVFTSEENGCEVETQSDEATVCYTVFDSDATVYNS